MAAGVYQISFASSDKKYIGSAVNLKKRQTGHLGDLRHGTHPNKHLQNAFSKYGEDVYRFKVLLICNPVNCVMYEQMVMDALTPERLYNIRIKAESNLGLKMSEETKKKVSKASAGRKLSPEAKAKMSVARMGIVYSDDTRAKMSASKRMMSEETKDKIRQARAKQVFTDETRQKLSLSAIGKHSAKRSPEACENIRAAQLKRVPTSEEARRNMSASAKKAWAKRKEVNSWQVS